MVSLQQCSPVWFSIQLISIWTLYTFQRRTLSAIPLHLTRQWSISFLDSWPAAKHTGPLTCAPHGQLWVSGVSPCCLPLSPHYQGEAGCHEYPRRPCHPACHQKMPNVTSGSKCWRDKSISLRHHMLVFFSVLSGFQLCTFCSLRFFAAIKGDV